MSKGLYMRTITAGRYQKTVRYTRVLPGDAKTVRAAKQAATNAAQKYINIKNTTENLQLLLCANFDRPGKSCFCTFTFKPGAEPANQKHAGKIFAGFVRKLRPYLKDSRYIYVVEGTSLKSCPSAAPCRGYGVGKSTMEADRTVGTAGQQRPAAAPGGRNTSTHPLLSQPGKRGIRNCAGIVALWSSIHQSNEGERDTLLFPPGQLCDEGEAR